MSQYVPKQKEVFKKALKQFSGAVLLLTTAYLLLPTLVSAATLSLDSAKGSFGPGDMFLVTVRLDTDTDECINAADITVKYPIEWLKATAFSKGESLLTLWPEEPVIDTEHGTVTFSGGIPAGYCGRVQGDPGRTNILGKVAFSINASPLSGNAPTAPLSVPLTFASSTKVLENDGFGTEAKLTLTGTDITRVRTSQGKTNEWLDIVRGDTIPPDEFKIEVAHDQATFGGKFFVVFSTVDKQSGVDHYEVSEDDPSRLGFVYGKNVKSEWKTTTSPYVLLDQTLQSRVIVRAIDNAGNIQEAILAPTNGDLSLPKVGASNSNRTLGAWCVIAALLGVVMGGILLFIRRQRTPRDVALAPLEPIDTENPN